MFNTFIFDCDGILVDTEHLKLQAWQAALAPKNISLTLEEYMSLAGYGSKHILKAIAPQLPPHTALEIIEQLKIHYRALQSKGVPEIAPMVAFVKKLSEEKKQRELRLGLASGGSRQEILFNLTQLGLQNAFDAIVSGTDDLDSYADPGEKNKPKPYIYLEIAKRLNVAPAHCLAFEDTAAGVASASSAGMTVIAIPNRFTAAQDFSKASAIIHSHDQLTKFLTSN